jgi:hypothetical protein
VRICNGVLHVAASCCMFITSIAAVSVSSAKAENSSDAAKIELFDLIANEEHQYLGIGPFPVISLSRWGAKLEILGIAPGHDAELKDLVVRVLAPLIDEVNRMRLAEFPGAELKVDAANPNVVVLVGDDFASFRDKLPEAGIQIWLQLFDAMERARAEMPYASCIHFLADDGDRTEIAGLIFVSTRSGAAKQKECAAQSLGQILGLRGKAMPEMSIISSTQSLDFLRPLDRKALEVIYGESRETNRSISRAIDEYLSR